MMRRTRPQNRPAAWGDGRKPTPGPCPLHLSVPRDQQTPLGPKGPRRRSTRESRWQRGEHWHEWGARGPAPCGPKHRCGERTQERSAPLALASLVLGSRGALSRFRSGDQRLISRDAKPKASLQQRSGTFRVPRADRDNFFAAGLMVAGVLLRRQLSLIPNEHVDGLRRSFVRAGHNSGPV
jgi:hypothetical protein